MSLPLDSETVALSALLYHDPNGRGRWAEIRDALSEGTSARHLLEYPAGELVPRDVRSMTEESAAELETWTAAGIQLLTPLDDAYPAQLRSVYDFPLALFARGEVVHDYRSAAIVGSREFSVGGQNFARDLATLLARDAVTVVSGLARGIDGTAHRAALAAGGRTVAVIGNGLNLTYPAEHRELQRVIEERGLVISQFRPETKPTRQTFPQRNVTMSAYSSVTVIVEAKEASGTRIQAAAAVKHGRPMVITEQVATTTSWGREYASGGFDVMVARTPEEAAELIGGVFSRSARPLQMSGV